MAEGLSREDKLRIAKHFLLTSPPAQFENVLSDVRDLIGDDDLLNESALDIFRTYNIEQLIPVDVPGADYKLILSKYSERDPTTYYDPKSNKVITVDHTRAVATEAVDDADEDDAVKARRVNLQTALDAYIKEHFLDGVGTVFPGASADEFIICISSSKFNNTNCWSGRWRSVYRVTYLDDTKTKLSGSMKINVHYYEDGNVQLNTTNEHGESIDSKSTDAVGSDISRAISRAETAFQRSLEETCSNLNKTTFKSLRRALPITGTLFDFSSAAHKLAVELNKSK